MNKMPLDFIRPVIRSKQIYSLPKVAYQIKLNQNENPNDLAEGIKSEIFMLLANCHWNRYPELTSSSLREQIADMLSLSGRQVMVGNGSNEILLAIMTAVLEPGKKLLIVEPTFSLYRHYGEILDATVEAAPLLKKFAFPVEQLTQLVRAGNVALTILCSPNNPTGNRIEAADLVKILTAATGLVLVDEAYIDFCAQDFAPLLNDFPNLILTRTFSKASSFAFGRFGYGLAAPELVQEIYKVLLPYNLSGLTELTAQVLLTKQQALKAAVVEIVSQRQWLFQQLVLIPEITVYPSSANFLLICPSCASDWLFQQLAAAGILVRDVSSYPGLGNHLRISVGAPAENQKLVGVMQSIFKSENQPGKRTFKEENSRQ